MNLSPLIFNAVGLIGIALIIIAYFLLQTKKISSNQPSYSLLNLTGALLHLVSLYKFWNLASFIIEIFWVGISFYGIYCAVKKVF